MSLLEKLRIFAKEYKEDYDPDIESDKAFLVGVDVTVSFVERLLAKAFADFPSCEVCPLDIDHSDHPNPPSNCYVARHQYPSKCPKDKWKAEVYTKKEEE